ncbi:MAG: excinuclease ABC subunit UvrC [Candidatus Saccharicenans sp.]|nr:excinuclease ABC subunit UvrC [Candidatus Saccharicenans sp.]
MNLEKLKEKVKKFPARPGIYFFKNGQGEIIYIGKARSLRDRVKSYFLPSPDVKVQNILSETADVDYLLVSSEKEASFIENNYIQFYQPRFNLRLKDDKSFPFIKISLNEEFPGVYLCRRVEDDGARYFGPFSPADEARKLISFLTKIFKLRTCENTVFRHRKRPCLEYDLKLCTAPCTGFISAAEYRENVSRALLLLEGKKLELYRELKKKMEQAAEELRFEEAARWRDALKALEGLKETQRVISTEKENLDIAGYHRQQTRAGFLVFHMREGRIRHSTGRILEANAGENDEQLLVRFLKQLYSSTEPAEKILLPFKLSSTLQSELQQALVAGGRKLTILHPQSRKHRVLLDLAAQNAALLFEKIQPESPLTELQKQLGLNSLPRRIEGFDISTTAGTEPVGSLVVFIDGQPARSEYRKYKIKTVTGPDDYASLKEVITRRLTRLLAENHPLPDLIFVDGGKGQLNLAFEVLSSLNLSKIPVCSLAKKEEVIFSTAHPEGLRLDPTSTALKLLQHIRDEAHRFAISFHRQRRLKASLTSELDGIAGLGPARKKKLLLTFGSLSAIREASEEQLASVVGRKLARVIKQKLS